MALTIAEKIETAQCELKEWQAAQTAAISGQAYSVDGISVTRQDIQTTIRPNIRRLQRSLLQLEAAENGATAPSVRVAVLRDRWA